MELSLANHGKTSPLSDQRKDRKEGGKSDKPFKRTTKDSMVINTTPLKIIGKNKKKEEEKFLDRRQEKGKEVKRERSRLIASESKIFYPIKNVALESRVLISTGTDI